MSTRAAKKRAFPRMPPTTLSRGPSRSICALCDASAAKRALRALGWLCAVASADFRSRTDRSISLPPHATTMMHDSVIKTLFTMFLPLRKLARTSRPGADLREEWRGIGGGGGHPGRPPREAGRGRGGAPPPPPRARPPPARPRRGGGGGGGAAGPAAQHPRGGGRAAPPPGAPSRP